MGAFFRTDPSITARGIPRPFDPIQAFSRIANLRRLQQRGQINQQTLEDMERERARMQAIRGAVGAGGTNADILRRLQQDAPLAGLAYREKFAAEQRAAAGEQRTAQKDQLERSKATYKLIGQLAGPLKVLEESEADLETMQVAYADSLAKLAAAGIDVSKLPQEYKLGMAQQAILEAVDVTKQIDQALRAEEAAERKAAREKKLPGVDVPFPADVEAQKKRVRAAGREPDRATRVQAAIARKNNDLLDLQEKYDWREDEEVFFNASTLQALTREQMRQRKQQIQNAFEEELKALGQQVEHFEYPLEWNPVQPATQPAEPAKQRLAKRADVERFAVAQGLTYEQAAQKLKAGGWTIVE
jgi:hypothetical protein